MTAVHGAVLRVGVLGHGAIGANVAGALCKGAVPGAALGGVLTRGADGAVPASVPDMRGLLASADVVVEAAGGPALREHGPAVLAAGRDLLAVSVGALADEDLFRELTRLTAAGSGRLLVCPGALGGLDALRAAALAGPLTRVRLTSSKAPASLVQPWMDEPAANRLRSLRPGDPPVTVFDGDAREAAVRFPRNANVAATVALAAGDWASVRVRLLADPDTPLTRHVVEFAGPVGEYRFELGNLPDPANPATSGLVAHAVLRSLADLVPGAAWRVA
ncbi:aspartate dehydrogenase domain-containing protein [Actinomadura violacea]|uniref:aspartate dehydrogenase domain-containing protein n=1 Tax=Actinomadura violacea TaxID=2819934 RepID=UPI0027DB33E5|nr:aspartate dehydrogenase domain-containing protein [Actinomadura violacea]